MAERLKAGDRVERPDDDGEIIDTGTVVKAGRLMLSVRWDRSGEAREALRAEVRLLSTDPTLEDQARALLPTLSQLQCQRAFDSVDCPKLRASEAVRGWLVDAGLAIYDASRWQGVTPTDLGRAVARLLSTEVARG